MPEIPSLQLAITIYTALNTVALPEVQTSTSISTREGRTSAVIDFYDPNAPGARLGDGLYTRDIGTFFEWPLNSPTALDLWQPSVIPLPENTVNRASDWMEGQDTGAKFIQGYSIEADSFNVPKFFQLQSGDDQSFHTFVEMPAAGTPFNRQTRKIFSCIPFIAHTVRRVTTDNVPWRVFEESMIYQPYPEAQDLWQTEMTDLNGKGWQHVRLINMAYQTTGFLLLTMVMDVGAAAPITMTVPMPPTSGLQQKQLLFGPGANKWKMVSFKVASAGATPAASRLWVRDCEIWVRSWGEDGPYRIEKPFGGPSTAEAQV